MIEFKTGDILQTDAEALVNTVNCVGIMGRGIALQFKQAFPDNFKAYEAACARKEAQPGRMLVFETGFLANPKYIVNFPTKRHWRGKSRIEDIEAGLKALVDEIRKRGIRSIAVPPLGSGLGGRIGPKYGRSSRRPSVTWMSEQSCSSRMRPPSRNG
jgi:O-acetyl-ADP-ribose deacetylase (regulator of RNase III)